MLLETHNTICLYYIKYKLSKFHIFLESIFLYNTVHNCEWYILMRRGSNSTKSSSNKFGTRGRFLFLLYEQKIS